VKCRFKCRNKTEFDDGMANVHLEPVQESNADNKAFFVNNPTGYFDVMAITPEASELFVVGQEYILDITQAM
jgi:hypothetical protein